MAQRRTLESALSKSQPGVEAEVVKAFVSQRTADQRGAAGGRAPNRLDGHAEHPDMASEKRAATASHTRFHPTGLVPVTIRLQPSVAGALKRASLERELAGEHLYTQQEIVESTLAVWLKDNGYLPTGAQKADRLGDAQANP